MDTYRLALTGDVILNTRPSVCRDRDVVAALDLLRHADVTHAHLEIPLTDLADADTFGAAEGALSWMCGPVGIADELGALGVDLVSAASNHSLDWSYGGLRSTVSALDAAGLPHAGIGVDLAAARAPAFVDTAVARVGLVSATSSFPAFARAGAARSDVRGRPGVNPQGYLSVVGPADADQLAALCSRMGHWVVRHGDELVIHPPGLHNSTWRLRVDPAASAPSTVCDPADLAGNLDALRHACSVADLVIAHLHVQAWDGVDGRMCTSPAFATEFAYAAIAAGAGVVLVQGSHAPMRGIELHAGVPILYDPGPLFRLARRDVQPHDFYTRWGNEPAVRSFDVTLMDAYGARDTTPGGDQQVLSPLEGNAHTPGFVLPVCEVDAATHRVMRVRLHPMRWSTARRSTTGFPVVVNGAAAEEILEHLAELSAPYGTKVIVSDGIGTVEVG